jgi:hypothetical protein
MKDLQRCLSLPWLILASLLLTVSVSAQNSLTDVVGIPPDAAMYPIPGVGFVNLKNGNLHIEMPIRIVKDRNGAPVTTNLLYDSSVWQQIQVPGPNGNPVPSWNGDPRIPTCTGCLQSLQILTSPYYQGQAVYTASPDPNCSNATQYKNWQYTDRHGTVHPFSTALLTESGGASECDVSTLAGAATDGSGYWIQITNTTSYTVYDTHGNIMAGGLNGATDTNGNHPPLGGVNDKLGRSTTLPSGFTVTYETIYVATNFTAGGNPTPFAATVIKSITLPGGRSYGFTYDDATANDNPGTTAH